MISRFESSRFDRKPVYICRICKKQTRDTGHDERSLELCAYCMQEAELENALNDGGIDQRQYDDRLAELQKQYKRGAFEKKTKPAAEKKTTTVADLISEFADDNAPKLPEPTRSTKRTSTKSRAPEAKRARKIIRNYLRIAIEFTMDEAITDAALAAAMDAAEEALSTLPGYEA